MMSEIKLIPIGDLLHHPENPRKGLGDLTELTESIRQRGVMQNLTVVADLATAKYLVVIGNRRLEAAKAAGLVELPCVISDMDHKEQIATMLMENMQRQDLTVYEQAQGFQMMMDLGFTEKEISEKTGFSRTTVDRRLKMAELDGETLREKCTQVTIEDLDRLGKIEDIGTRNELLKEAGTSNFSWKVDKAISKQKQQKNYQKVREILLRAGCIERTTEGIADFWQKYDFLPYNVRIDLDKYEEGQDILPEDERQLYFEEGYGTVRFWAEKRSENAKEAEEPDDEETAEERAKQKEAQDAWAQLKEIEQQAKESRAKFMETMTVKQKDNRKALEWMIVGLTVTFDAEIAIGRLLPDYDDDQIKNLPEGFTETDLALKWIREQIETNPHLYAQVMDGIFFDGQDSVDCRWRNDKKPEYCRNLSMITGYKWLEDFGYQVSDDERAYLDGTLEYYEAEA